MSLFTQLLAERATFLSQTANDQDQLDPNVVDDQVSNTLSEVGVQAPNQEEITEEEVNEEAVPEDWKDHIDDHEKTIDEIGDTADAEVTLESLQTILTKSMSRGGMSVGELESFALVQSLVGRQLGINISSAPDMQSYTQMGAARYTALSSEQTEAAKTTLWEKFKALIAKLIQFAKRILEKLTLSWTRIGLRATHLLDRLKKVPPHTHPTTPITSRKIIEPLYRKGAHLSVNEIRQVTQNIIQTTKLFEVAIAQGKFDPADKVASDRLLEKLQKDMEMMPDHSPQVIPKGAEVSGWERLKFWKEAEPISNLPQEIERLNYNECIVAANTIQVSALTAKRDDSKTGAAYIKRMKELSEKKDPSGKDTKEILRAYPILYTAYCRFNHWSAKYANSVLNYIEVSAFERVGPNAKTVDSNGKATEDGDETKFKDVN